MTGGKAMARVRFSVLALGLASLLALLAACGGEPAKTDPTPVLYSIEIAPNPVDAYQTATFIVSWRDGDGDMRRPTVAATLHTEDDQTLELPIEDVSVSGGPYSGAISFNLVVFDAYQGNVAVTVTDEAGNVSDQIEEYLYVNQAPADED
jgi:hypothetical protein